MGESLDLREHCVSSIHQDGYVSLPIHINTLDIQFLFEDFKKLMADINDSPLPKAEHLRNAFKVVTPGRPEDGTGYIESSRKGMEARIDPGGTVADDDKDVLHYVPYTPAKVTSYFGNNHQVPYLAHQVMEACEFIRNEVKRSLRPALTALGLDKLILAPRGGELDEVHLVRVIRYLGSQATAESAEALDPLADFHFDRSKLTAAVWEDRDGLVGIASDNLKGNPKLTLEELDTNLEKARSTPISHQAGQLKLLAGAGYHYLTEEEKRASGNLPLLLHGVVDNEPGRERFAVVVFLNELIDLERGVPLELHEKNIGELRKHLAGDQLSSV